VKQLDVRKLMPEAQLPTRSYEEDAGLDLYAVEDIFIPIGNTVSVRTGIAIHIFPGYVGKIEDRSGLANKGLRTGGGVIDAKYDGEVKVVLHNLTNESVRQWVGFDVQAAGYQVKKGDRIAQLLIYEVSTPTVREVGYSWGMNRKTSGHGSTGR